MVKKKGSETEKVCGNLCAIETSFPDIDEFLQWVVEVVKLTN